ncbi:MAG: FecCD family ABC transporter permease [Brevibacterium aurantiacum]|uniref:FecCD family ABC transporter permease n=1 Tax=Brevibacterium aurantiacum TaxID=273384 RepID=UPI003F92B3F2
MSVLTLRAGPVSMRWRRRPLLVGVCLAMLTLAAIVTALMLGTLMLSPAEVLDVLTGRGSHIATKFVTHYRGPRAIAAAVFGAALGLSGAVFQSLLRNPLASPDIVGFTTGSYTGVLLVVLAGGAGFAAFAAGALIGGLVTTLAIYLLAFRRGVQGFRLIIMGIAVSSVLTSINTWIVVRADVDIAMRAAIWGAGTLANVRWPVVLPGIIAVAVLTLVLSCIAPSLRELQLGDDAAAMLGRRVEVSKLLLVLTAVALIAAVTAVTGPIGFIALAAPQIARRLTRAGGTPLLSAALVGAFGLSASDIIAQHTMPWVKDVPVGAVTVVLGGAYLLWLLIRESRKL